MKKPVILLSVFIFSLALVVFSLTWADKQEGSGTKTTKPSHDESSGSTIAYDEHKDKKYSKEYPSGQAGHIEEGSGAKQPQDESSGLNKKEESSGAVKKTKSAAPKREGS